MNERHTGLSARLLKVLFSLTRVCTAFCVFMVSFKEIASLGSLIQLALQFLNVEMRFPMLTEGSRSGSSLLFFLGTTMSEKLFLAVFLYFNLKQSPFQRTLVCHIGFVLLGSVKSSVDACPCQKSVDRFISPLRFFECLALEII
jgi:hypothetical protein